MNFKAHMIHLKDIAAMLDVSLATLYGDWQDRVLKRQIPPADPRFTRPTWHAEETAAWLKNPPPATAEKAKGQGRPKADPEGDALRNRMNRNREGRSHAA